MFNQNISQKPNLKIHQKINSNLINSIKILQMSSHELAEYTQTEIEKNPFLIYSQPNTNINKMPDIDSYSKNSNIKEWLYEQSSFISVNTWGQKLVKYFIENLDNKGFCKISMQDASRITQTSLSQSILVLETTTSR